MMKTTVVTFRFSFRTCNPTAVSVLWKLVDVSIDKFDEKLFMNNQNKLNLTLSTSNNSDINDINDIYSNDLTVTTDHCQRLFFRFEYLDGNSISKYSNPGCYVITKSLQDPVIISDFERETAISTNVTNNANLNNNNNNNNINDNNNNNDLNNQNNINDNNSKNIKNNINLTNNVENLNNSNNNSNNCYTLRFKINYHTYYGQILYIIGSLPELGYWEISKGLRLFHSGTISKDSQNRGLFTDTRFNWQCDVTLKGNFLPGTLSYRYVVVNECAEPFIEPGNVRYLCFAQDLKTTFLEFNDIWRWNEPAQSLFSKRLFDETLFVRKNVGYPIIDHNITSNPIPSSNNTKRTINPINPINNSFNHILNNNNNLYSNTNYSSNNSLDNINLFDNNSYNHNNNNNSNNNSTNNSNSNLSNSVSGSGSFTVATMRDGYVLCVFCAHCGVVGRARRLFVVGSIQELGQWNPSKGAELKPSADLQWSANVIIPRARFPFEFKFVAVGGADAVVWETHENRFATLSDSQHSMPMVSIDSWHLSFANLCFHGSGVCVDLNSISTSDFGLINKIAVWSQKVGFAAIHFTGLLDTTAMTRTFSNLPLSGFALNPLFADLSEFNFKITPPEELRENILSQKICFMRDLWLQNRSRYDDHVAKFRNDNLYWIVDYENLCFARHREAPLFPMESFCSTTTTTTTTMTMKDEYLRFVDFVQFLLYLQLNRANKYARDLNVAVGTDIVFAVSEKSAEALYKPQLFHTKYSLGAPPTVSNPIGVVLEAYPYNFTNAEEWFRKRISHFSQFFSIIRLESTVCFFRQWVVPRATSVLAISGHFEPSVSISFAELETWGLWDIERYVQPYIRPQLLQRLFGNEDAMKIQATFLVHGSDGSIFFKEQFSSEKGLATAPLDENGEALRRKYLPQLLRLLNEVLLIRVNEHEYRPRPLIKLAAVSNPNNINNYSKNLSIDCNASKKNESNAKNDNSVNGNENDNKNNSINSNNDNNNNNAVNKVDDEKNDNKIINNNFNNFNNVNDNNNNMMNNTSKSVTSSNIEEESFSFSELPLYHQSPFVRLEDEFVNNKQRCLWSFTGRQVLQRLTAANDATFFSDAAGTNGEICDEALQTVGVLPLRVQMEGRLKTAAFDDIRGYPYLSVASPQRDLSLPMRVVWKSMRKEASRLWVEEFWESGQPPVEYEDVVAENIMKQHCWCASMWVLFPIDTLVGAGRHIVKSDHSVFGVLDVEKFFGDEKAITTISQVLDQTKRK